MILLNFAENLWCRTRRGSSFRVLGQITYARDYFWGDAGRSSEKRPCVVGISLANEVLCAEWTASCYGLAGFVQMF